MRITVNLTSQCYRTKKELRKDRNTVANKAKKVMETFKKSERDKITLKPGSVFLNTVYTGTHNNRRELCKNKWQSSAQLVFEMSDLESWDSLEDELLEVIEEHNKGIDEAQGTFTKLAISNPSFHLYQETQEELEEEAQLQADYKLSRLFKRKREVWGLENCTLVSYSETVPSNQKVYTTTTRFRSAAMAEGSSSDTIPEMNPDNIVIWATANSYGKMVCDSPKGTDGPMEYMAKRQKLGEEEAESISSQR